MKRTCTAWFNNNNAAAVKRMFPAALLTLLCLITGLLQAETPPGKTLIVGSEQDYPPFALGATDETAGGFTVELWKAVAAESGLGYRISVKPFHQLLQDFKDGKIDVLINLAQSDERRRFADFTVPTVVAHGAIFVRKGDTGIRSEADLAGKSIIVLNADKAHDYALSKGWQKQLVPVDTSAAGFELLAAGRHDAMLLSKLVGLQTLEQLTLPNIEVSDAKAGFSQKFSFAVSKGNADLLAKINEGLALSKSSGVYDSLYEKWFGIYEEKEASLSDIIIAIALILLILIGIDGFTYYRRIRERKEAAKKLEDSHNLLKTIIDATPMRIFWKDRESRYLGCNTLFAQDAGAAHPDDLLGKDDYQLAWKAHAARNHADDQEIIASGKAKISYDAPQAALDGRQTWLRTSKVPLLNTHNGEIIGVLGIYEDITRHKQTEESLRKLSLAVEQSPHSIVITDLDAKIEYINPAFTKETGYNLAEVIGQNPRLLNAGKTPKQTYADMWTALTNGELWKGELINRRKDGSEYIELALISPIRQPDGQITHYLSIKENITERKQAEAELRIAAIAFEAQEGMIITDARSIILRVNRTFTEITGYTAEEAVGQKMNLLKSGRHDAAFYETMWASIHATGTWQGEIWNRRKNGEIYPEWITITAVKSDDGTVSHYVSTMTDITLRKAAENEIQHLAFFDPLTQLPNRRLLLDRLETALAASTRSKSYGALMFIDLDNFKTLNDTLGHDMGDILLQQVAERLDACMRANDTVARLGGDEFVVMLENLGDSAEEAAALSKTIGEKILSALNQTYQLANHQYHSTPSIGIALFAGSLDTVDELLKHADIAMYEAKAAGRNTLRFFDPKMQVTINARAALEADLHQALANNEFKLYFQVQVTHSYQVIGVEALLRWQHPERGLLLPSEFIALAEETGLILPISQWILEAACDQIKRWENKPLAQQLHLAVNISARQFYQPDFVGQICSILAKTAIHPSRLKLELTERLVRSNIDDAIIKMLALKRIGVHFSMDNFGIGCSSLPCLAQLPLEQLKIDQSFVSNIGIKSSDNVIVQIIIGMAGNLNLDVIAEGVETEEQRAFLKLNGCSNYQGYLLGRPMPIEEFECLLGV